MIKIKLYVYEYMFIYINRVYESVYIFFVVVYVFNGLLMII